MYYYVLFFSLVISTSTEILHNGNGSYSDDLQTQKYVDSRNKRETKEVTSGACVLPPFPRHGSYKVANVPKFLPGQSFSSFILRVGCRRGYGIIDADASLDAAATQTIYCINGDWSQNMPKCVRFCKLDPHPSVRYMCSIPGTFGFKVCKNYVAPGTAVNPVCNSPVYYTSESLLYMNCRTGFWDYIAVCKPECGRVTPVGDQLLIDGQAAMRGELPWHVGVYRKTDLYEQICGGTLVTNNAIISAAHCFWKSLRKKLPASEFAVAVGKLYRPWDHERDVGAQQSNVKEIRIPRLFEGESANFQEDIAVVFLTSALVYEPHVRPICLNFDAVFDRWQLRHGNMGRVAGWGLIAANGQSSLTLKVLDMPYINADICIMTLPKTFREYITGDKFCAGYTNGTALCRGDSGGGLTFPEKDLGVERYYLRGIVSVAPTAEGKECNDKAYTTFTKISKHELFIKESIAAATPKNCPWYQFQCDNGECVDQGADCNGYQECADGSDESDDLCKVVITEFETTTPSVTTPKPECVLPPYPNNGKYEVLGDPNAKPGQVFPNFVLNVKCNPGYSIETSTKAIDLDNSRVVYCANGEWIQKMPECNRFCKLDPHPSIIYMCPINGSSELKPCPQNLASGAFVRPVCNAPNYISTQKLPDMKCIAGFWDYVAICEPACGLPSPQGQPLIIGGRTAKRGELPWHVGIYIKKTRPFMQLCGGTIVSTKVVVSAAHCVWTGTGNVLPSDYAVAAGKLYRTWDHVNDIDAQKSDVQEIKLPEQYKGHISNYQADICAIILKSQLVYKIYVRPICLDFDAEFNEQQLQPGNLGKVTGWGLTSPNGNPSQDLQVAELPYISTKECQSAVPPSFLPYITYDKFCAGYTNGTVVCKYDSGGGVFAKNGYRYYLRGIISTAPAAENGEICNPNTYITMTMVSKYKDFLTENLV